MDDLDKTTPPPESEQTDEEKPFLKPKAKRQISEERRKEMSERMKRINQERIDKAREARKGELELKEQRKLAELERIRERRALTEISVEHSLKSHKKLKAEGLIEDVPEKVKTKVEKKPKKAPVVVYESESESDDYEGGAKDGEESEEEVLIVKKKKSTKSPEQPILKAKGRPRKDTTPEAVAPPAPSKPVIRFI